MHSRLAELMSERLQVASQVVDLLVNLVRRLLAGGMGAPHGASKDQEGSEQIGRAHV